MTKRTIILIGAGRMGGAMLRGWLNVCSSDHHFIAVDPHAKTLLSDLPQTSAQGATFEALERVDLICEDVNIDVVFLATKPQMIYTAIRDFEHKLNENTVIISVAAGVGTDTMSKALSKKAALIRAMPNIGALVGYCVSAAFAQSHVTPSQRELAAYLFNAFGQFDWVDDEDQLHTVTAVSGSGPAYFFAMCESMIKAACAQGLSPEVSKSLVLGTLSAAGRLLEDTPDPTFLRETVTSPNGTTAAGLSVLTEENALDKLAHDVIAAAQKRSIELS